MSMTDKVYKRLGSPVMCQASGWMQVRARARQSGVELPLIISDHADWTDLTRTIEDVNADETWITHGRDDALIRWAALNDRKAMPLHLIGYEDEDS